MFRVPDEVFMKTFIVPTFIILLNKRICYTNRRSTLHVHQCFLCDCSNVFNVIFYIILGYLSKTRHKGMSIMHRRNV